MKATEICSLSIAEHRRRRMDGYQAGSGRRHVFCWQAGVRPCSRSCKLPRSLASSAWQTPNGTCQSCAALFFHRETLEGLQSSEAFADLLQDIIFVAPKHIHEVASTGALNHSRQMMCQDVLDYYSKIMQFRGIQNPPGRFQAILLCTGEVPHIAVDSRSFMLMSGRGTGKHRP